MDSEDSEIDHVIMPTAFFLRLLTTRLQVAHLLLSHLRHSTGRAYLENRH
jgi:hypothetical protein